jgi:hypothetical protein
VKKLIVRAVVVVLFAVFCFSYSIIRVSADAQRFSPFADRFDMFCGDSVEHVILDKATGVCYLWVNTSYEGGICPMYNADGSLVVWEEEQRVQEP